MSQLNAFTTGRTWDDGGISATTAIDVNCDATVEHRDEDNTVVIRWQARQPNGLNTQTVELRLPKMYAERVLNDLTFVLATSVTQVMA